MTRLRRAVARRVREKRLRARAVLWMATEGAVRELFEAHMAHPLATKAIAAGRVKNDKVDASLLAQLLRANLLPEGV